MTRTTTPDVYTATVRHIRDLRKEKRISPFAFAVVIRYVWEARLAEGKQ